MSGILGQGLRDSHESAAVTRSELLFTGFKWDIVSDHIDLGDGQVLRREFVRHPGAVAVLALDADDRVLLISQYRHPVRMRLWELPAGLLDEPGEDPAVAAARELAEEVDLIAERLDVLVDLLSSPGGSDEALRVYLARGVRPVPQAQRHVRSEEEAGIEVAWFGLDDAVTAVLTGAVHNAAAVAGLLAASAARARGWETLRPREAPWPEHPDRRPEPRPVASREDNRVTQS